MLCRAPCRTALGRTLIASPATLTQTSEENIQKGTHLKRLQEAQERVQKQLTGLYRRCGGERADSVDEH